LKTKLLRGSRPERGAGRSYGFGAVLLIVGKKCIKELVLLTLLIIRQGGSFLIKYTCDILHI
jgi:hypothetical protein